MRGLVLEVCMDDPFLLREEDIISLFQGNHRRTTRVSCSERRGTEVTSRTDARPQKRGHDGLQHRAILNQRLPTHRLGWSTTRPSSHPKPRRHFIRLKRRAIPGGSTYCTPGNLTKPTWDNSSYMSGMPCRSKAHCPAMTSTLRDVEHKFVILILPLSSDYLLFPHSVTRRRGHEETHVRCE